MFQFERLDQEIIAALFEHGNSRLDRRMSGHEYDNRVRVIFEYGFKHLHPGPVAQVIGTVDLSGGVVEGEGGAVRGERRLQEFLENGLSEYTEKRNDPETEGTSRLSPYLHFGHISAHQVFHEVIKREGWFFSGYSVK